MRTSLLQPFRLILTAGKVIIVNSLSLNAVTLAGIEVIAVMVSRVVYTRVPLEEISGAEVESGDDRFATVLRSDQVVFLAGSNGAVSNGTTGITGRLGGSGLLGGGVSLGGLLGRLLGGRLLGGVLLGGSLLCSLLQGSSLLCLLLGALGLVLSRLLGDSSLLGGGSRLAVRTLDAVFLANVQVVAVMAGTPVETGVDFF